MSHNWICERCQESVVASGSRSDVALFSPFGCNKAQQTAARVGKGPQRVQVFPNPPNVEADVGILEIEVNTRGLLVPELAVGAIGLLLREPTNPPKKRPETMSQSRRALLYSSCRRVSDMASRKLSQRTICK
jgi:hypothetical protein